MTTDFARRGAEHFPGGGADALPALSRLAAGSVRPGRRLTRSVDLAAILDPDGPLHAAATGVLGDGARPVRAVLFDKTPAADWGLGWHQDRTVAVAERLDRPGWGPWTVKQGLLHAEPPFAVIEAMATIRLHLDAVPADNAPLLVAPGSHRLGRVPEREIADAVARCGTLACLAEPGDLWLYATPILHASAPAGGRHAHRRVLQLDYAARDLPDGMRWAGL